METDVFQGRLRLHFHPDWPGVHHLKILGLLQVSSLHWKKRSWISRCCCLHLFLPSWFLALQDSQRCCSENPKASVEEQNSSRGSGKMRDLSPPHS
ncbi:mitochondrial coiled-coil domain protein 1 isoform X7 [Pongo pygmaeus]|uniref:mitochondrial coiled-coil domain protein 1 isoform X7 n=1 Tax=Pongo pygmaeus TaxID=9600 RepID=UPI00300D9330